MRSRLFTTGAAAFARALVLLSIVSLLPSCAPSAKAPDPGKDAEGPLVVYAYDSFTAEWGPGPKLAALYEAKTGRKLELVSKGDAGLVLSAALLEKGAPEADVYIGIDDQLASRALKADLFEAYKPEGAERVSADLVMDGAWRLTPYDWGAFAIIQDTEKLALGPESLEALADPAFKRRLILLDARTSTPGLGFVAWTLGIYGDAYLDYWKRLKPSLLTLAPGWDSGYGLFTAGEAPLVLSYTTSPAYHLEYESTRRYQALVFPEGHPYQIEGAGIAKGSRRPAAARALMDLLLSPEFQKEIPLTQWMYPVDPGIELPASFSIAPVPKRAPRADPERLADAVDAIQAVLAP